MATDKPLKIISLQAENVKKITALSITPTGNLVQITGKNRSGKTSTLDAIWWALAGAGNVQSAPIRKGQDKATIKLDLGDVVVTRTFTQREDGSAGTSIVVENGEGARYPTPQKMLDSLLGSLTFDPLHFARMKPKEQFDTLKRFVPDVDFENIDGLNRADFAKRADVNRKAKELAGQIAGIAIPEATPAEKVDEAALIQEIGEVGAFNSAIELRKDRRAQVAADAKRQRADAASDREKVTELKEQIADLEERAATLEAGAAAKEKQLAEAPALDDPKDAAEVTSRLEKAKRTNALVDQAARRSALQAEAAKLATESKAIGERMEVRDADKRAKIAAAKLPVGGLAFAEEAILLNGVPFDQASDAEQLSASIAIAMASNPRLRVIRVRDGSLLDEDSMKVLAEIAEAADCQVWVESVDSSGKVGIVLEDGHVASTPETRAAQEAA